MINISEHSGISGFKIGHSKFSANSQERSDSLVSNFSKSAVLPKMRSTNDYHIEIDQEMTAE